MNSNYYIVIRDSDGYILSCGLDPQPLENIPISIANTSLKRITDEQSSLLFVGDKHYRYDQATDTIVELPPKPLDGRLWLWEAGSWQDKSTTQQKWARLRDRRNSLLDKADIAVLRQLEETGSVPQDLKTYRQQLRDLPEMTQDPDQVTWPTPPEGYGLTTTFTPVTIG